MNASGATVVHQALAFLREPVRPDHARPQRLPDDLRPLLRILAQDAEALASAVEHTGESADHVRNAASLYLQSVLFAAGSDSYRVLGVNPDASDERIKEHHRLLVRWLHPDRNPDGWETEYLYRVNTAWQDLRGSERRSAFDDRRRLQTLEPADGLGAEPDGGRQTIEAFRHGAPGARFLSPHAAQRMPLLLFGLLALAAVVGLSYLHAIQPPVEDLDYVAPVSKDPATATQRVAARSQDLPRPFGPISRTNDAVASAIATPAGVDIHDEASASAVDVDVDDAGSKPSERASTPVADVAAPRMAPPAADAATTGTRQRAASGVTPAAFMSPVAQDSGRAIVPPPPDAVPHENAAIHRLDSRDERPSTIAVSAPQAPQRPSVASARAAATFAAPPIDEAEARRLVDRFARAYEVGDVEALDLLFARDTPDERTRRDTLRAYRKLFRASQQRTMVLSNISVIGSGDTGAVIATFVTSSVARGAPGPRQTRGDIRFDLLRENGQLHIYRLWHEGRSG